MSLSHKRKSTEKGPERSRRNGRKSHGAVTPEGKARAARANLRHGFYARESPEVMIALGENPDDYRRLMDSLENNLAEGLENQLVRGIGRAIWRMQRSERMQDGLALKRMQKGMQQEDLVNSIKLLQKDNNYQHLLDLARDLARPDYFPSAEDVRNFANSFGTSPSDDIKKLFPLLQALSDAARGRAGGSVESQEGKSQGNAAGQAAESARQELRTALDSVLYTQRESLDLLLKDRPRDENSMLMQRMEDSSLRQLWRLMNMLVKVRNGALE